MVNIKQLILYGATALTLGLSTPNVNSQTLEGKVQTEQTKEMSTEDLMQLEYQLVGEYNSIDKKLKEKHAIYTVTEMAKILEIKYNNPNTTIEQLTTEYQSIYTQLKNTEKIITTEEVAEKLKMNNLDTISPQYNKPKLLEVLKKAVENTNQAKENLRTTREIIYNLEEIDQNNNYTPNNYSEEKEQELFRKYAGEQDNVRRTMYFQEYSNYKNQK